MIELKQNFEELNEEELTKGIISNSQEYHLNEFPNPNRQGCPSNKLIIENGESIAPDNEDFYTHLLKCSPCLKDFQVARNKNTLLIRSNLALENETELSKSRFLVQLVPIMILVLVFLGLLGFLLFKQ